MKHGLRYLGRCAVALAICLLLTTVLTGCWDDAEINGRAFVLGFGADAGQRAGSYDFTFQMAIPVSGHTDSSGAIRYLNCTVTEDTPVSAVRLLERNLGRQINFEQLNLIVIGEDLSRRGFVSLTEPFFRRASVRRQSCLAVCRGSAKAFLNASVTDRAIASDTAIALQQCGDMGGSDAAALNLHALYKALCNEADFYLPRVSVSESDALTGSESATASDSRDQNASPVVSLAGAALYAGEGRYLGELNAHELELLCLLAGRRFGGVIKIPGKEGAEDASVCYRVRQSECRIRCRLREGKPFFTLRLHVDCVPADGVGVTDGASDARAFTEQARRSVAAVLTDELNLLSEKCRRFHTSLPGLQTATRQQIPEWEERPSSERTALCCRAPVEFRVNCTVWGRGILR